MVCLGLKEILKSRDSFNGLVISTFMRLSVSENPEVEKSEETIIESLITELLNLGGS